MAGLNFLDKLSTLTADNPAVAYHQMQAQQAETNYLNDPAGTINNVGAIRGELPEALGLRNDQQQQNANRIAIQQAQDAQRLEAQQRITTALQGVHRSGGDVGAAFDSFAPTLAGHGMTADELAQLKKGIIANPTILDALDTKLQEARSKLINVGPGGTVYDPMANGGHGASVYSSPYKPMAIRDAMGNTTVFQPNAPGGPAAGGAAAAPGGNFFSHILAAENSDSAPGQPFRVSPKGAVGPAQLMPETAKEAAQLAGLPFNAAWKTNRATNLAMGEAYYNKQLSDFGDPALAAAAYNAGPARVRQAVSAAQAAGDPSSWLSHLPAETQKYVQNFTSSASGNAAPGGKVLFQTNANAAGVDGGLTDAAKKMVAERYKIDGSLPPLGMGKQAAALRTEILNKAAEGDTTGASIVANKADLHALQGSYSNQQKIYGQVTVAEQAALKNGQLFMQISRASPGQTQFPIANKLIQQYGGNVGNAKVRAMNAASEVFAQEYGKAISGAAGGSSALTVSASEHARNLIRQQDTPQAKMEVMRTLTADMHNRIDSFRGNIAATRDAIAHIGAAPTAAPRTTVHAAGTLTPGKGGVLVWSPK